MKTCRVCALGISAAPEGGVYCYKFKRSIPPDDAVRDWGCRYFIKVIPDEDFGPHQYLLLKETELAIRQ